MVPSGDWFQTHLTPDFQSTPTRHCASGRDCQSRAPAGLNGTFHFIPQDLTPPLFSGRTLLAPTTDPSKQRLQL